MHAEVRPFPTYRLSVVAAAKQALNRPQVRAERKRLASVSWVRGCIHTGCGLRNRGGDRCCEVKRWIIKG
jgi:hypothetical protein